MRNYKTLASHTLLSKRFTFKTEKMAGVEELINRGNLI